MGLDRQVHQLSRPLLAWLEEPISHRGIYFAQSGAAWNHYSYEDLASLTHRVAWSLHEVGPRNGEVVCLVLRSSPEFVATFFGAMQAGCIPCPVAPALTFQDSAVFADHLVNVFKTAQPSMVITHSDVMAGLPESLKAISSWRTIEELVGNAPPLPDSPQRSRASLAMLQFTSGSSARCRGVKVPFCAVEANVDAIRRWLRWTDADSFASWLPLHHDMGLVGALISSVVSGTDLWLLQPDQFVRNPRRYLECFDTRGATLTVTAAFGLEYIVRKVKPESLQGLDFSRWKGLVVGAERISGDIVRRFEQLVEPRGLRRGVILPAYGMAESTLAITGLLPGEPWAEATVTSIVASPDPTGDAADRAGQEADTVVGCGRPLQGIVVGIVDDDDRPLPDLSVGEIVVSGTSMTAGYLPHSEPSVTTQFDNGRLHTGDAGFMRDGQLFVIGRLGDSVKIRGRSVFSEDVEVALIRRGVPRERVAALLGVRPSGLALVVVVERLQGRWLDEIRELVTRYTADVRVLLLDAPKGTITRTSSGKPKRRELWRRFVSEQLPGKIVWDGRHGRGGGQAASEVDMPPS